MGKSKDSSIENIVRLSSRCEKSYKKLRKKGDRKLLELVNESIDKLKTDEKAGQETVSGFERTILYAYQSI